MKILLISYWFPPSKSIGAKRWGEFYQLSKVDKGLDITVLTANWDGIASYDNNIKRLGEKISYIPSAPTKSTGFLDMLRHPTSMLRSLDRSLTTSWFRAASTWIEADDGDFDIIISSFGPIGSVVLGGYAKAKYKIPYVIDLRDLISIQGQKRKVFFVNTFDKLLDKFLTRRADGFIAVSPTCEKKAVGFYNVGVALICNGLASKISDVKVDLSIQNTENINILYAGTLGVNRNPVAVLTVLDKYASTRNTSITIKFATSGGLYDFIAKDQFNNLKILDMGYLSSEDLSFEMDHSDALLVLEGHSYHGNENLTGKIFEYLRAKKPIMLSCHKGSDIVHLLKELNAGSLIEDESDLIEFLGERRFLDVKKCNGYSRENQYRLLKEYLKTFITK